MSATHSIYINTDNSTLEEDEDLVAKIDAHFNPYSDRDGCELTVNGAEVFTASGIEVVDLVRFISESCPDLDFDGCSFSIDEHYDQRFSSKIDPGTKVRVSRFAEVPGDIIIALDCCEEYSEWQESVDQIGDVLMQSALAGPVKYSGEINDLFEDALHAMVAESFEQDQVQKAMIKLVSATELKDHIPQMKSWYSNISLSERAAIKSIPVKFDDRKIEVSKELFFSTLSMSDIKDIEHQTVLNYIDQISDELSQDSLRSS